MLGVKTDIPKTTKNVPKTRKSYPKTRNAGKVSAKPPVLDVQSMEPVAVDTNVSKNIPKKRNGKVSTKPELPDDKSISPVSQNPTKKNVPKTSNAGKISDFFKAASKPVDIENYERNNYKAGDSRQFYLEALKKKLRSKDCSLSEICVRKCVVCSRGYFFLLV